MNLFVDASFLVSAFNTKDVFHKKAKEIEKRLSSQISDYNLVSSNIVLAETTNVIFRSDGAKAARKFYKTFKKSLLEKAFVTKEIFDEGYKILFSQKYEEPLLNLFDCLHLATMKKLGIGTILTFDKAFAKYVKILP